MQWNEHTVICTYRVREGARDAFLDLLRKHWPTLRAAGLASEAPAVHFEAKEDPDDPHAESGTTFIEIFSWASADSPGLAHRMPEVMAVWEPMGGLTEARGGRPPMEFPHVRPLDLGGA
ncbi:MAG TPA: hypothetical protein VGB08_00845 [Allosphingosinicella sp.]|jgi:quinol monooxygenase YgiN